MASVLPPVPPTLKPIQHYLKTAVEHDQREPVVAYWCRLYALQTGLKIDKKSNGCAQLLGAIMDWLEEAKKQLRGNEAVSNEVVAQAHLENYALKLFLWADTEDRASRFNKNVVKAFYTAGMLFDVLTTFGELTEEVVHHRKYAKWKAAYIHNCLKNGEVPVPGPMQSEGDEDFGAVGGAPDLIGGPSPQHFPPDVTGQDYEDEGIWTQQPPPNQSFPQNPQPKPRTVPPPSSNPSNGMSPSRQPAVPTEPSAQIPPSTEYSGMPALKPDDLIKAQKYCKWAGSALQYEDVKNAVDNLQKALLLLTTGKDS